MGKKPAPAGASRTTKTKKLNRHKGSRPIRFADLFAGIGGFHLALHNLGAKCVFASEWDEHARETYRHNFYSIDPEMFDSGNFVGDITKVDPASIPDIDLLCGGFPCQPFSNAGQKKGFADSRGTLFFNIAQIIKEKQPRAFFLENVRNLVNHDEGRTFEVIQRVLTKELGYSLHWKLIKASDFNVPQYRPRVYMVGFKDPKTPFSFPDPVPLQITMSDIFGAPCARKVGFTLRVGGRGSALNDRRNWDRYVVAGKERQLKSDVAKLMQGYPKSFEFPVREVQAMKQLGNSVAVPVIQAIGAEILKSLKK